MSTPYSVEEAAQIQHHLKHLVELPSFARSPVIVQLLTYLVRQELAGEGERLKGYTVGVEGLNKPADFDPSVDSGVRVELGRLRRMLEAAYAEDPMVNMVIEIPKGSYRPRFTQREAPPQHSLESHFVPSAGPAVAILAFDTVSDSEAEKRLVTGLRVEVLNELYPYKEFHFVDASGLSGSDRDVHRRCRDEFDCEFLVKSTIQSDGQQANIHFSVTDLLLNHNIWAKRYDLDLEDVLDTARNLAGELSRSLAAPTGVLGMSAIRKRLGVAPADWQASDCILRWHLYRLRDKTKQNHAAVRAQVRELLNRDPGFAYGYVIYAMLKLDEVVYRMNPEGEDADALDRALFLVNQGITIDPENAIGHYTLAQCYFFRNELVAFRASIEECLRLNPRNSDLLHHCGAFIGLSGDWEVGTNLLERGGMRYHSGVGYRLAYLMQEWFLGTDPLEGVRLFETAYIPPDFSVAYIGGALIYARAGQKARAVDCLRRAYAIEQHLDRDLETLVCNWIKSESDRSAVLEVLGDLARSFGIVVPLKS
ncbi:MAG: hypothetical protein JJ921_07865 [Pseudomonadales bacterium]|nr:hypothetical protein [Pseudomonadales bacterium]MBO6563428.1 hypothetical protein [Pseudomonadales bacterium]MBO6595743.1 hypothetical protein [Pseudomonadales bacterium]MBO6702243.1 hypothetical protein [Pseudomonadales bacterium]MBO6820699.1 hypothetical protein [Pseudomonadales bacterium]